MKIGNRVTVKPGVSPCTDAGSISIQTPNGVPRDRFIGKVGEIVAIDGDKYLVDSQMVNGKPQGPVEMRELFLESELEVG